MASWKVLAVATVVLVGCLETVGEVGTDGSVSVGDAGASALDSGSAGDAGLVRRDAGGTDDAGAVDAGMGEIDAGAFDAGPVVDAGAADAGKASDAGGPAVDAGTAADAGPTDGGAVDGGAVDAGAPPVEVCDGLDNDLDGLVDEWPDGGSLTRACPMTLGVCATARSLCSGGEYQPCDYGPDFQALETRCDGLDNDCDGRPDQSRSRVLIEDAGKTYGDVIGQFFEEPTGYLLNIADDALWIDHELNVTNRVQFDPGFLIPPTLLRDRDGENFVRVTTTNKNDPTYFRLYRMFADGGVTRGTDGGYALIAEYAEVQGNGSNAYAVQPTDAGWVIFAARDIEARRIQVSSDGGVASRFIDAGAERIYPATNGTGFWYTNALSLTCSVFFCDIDLSCSEAFASEVGGCGVAQLAPLWFGSNGSIIDATTGLTFATIPFGGRRVRGIDRFAIGRIVDGGAEYRVLNADGGMALIARIDQQYRPEHLFGASLYRVGPELSILTWATDYAETSEFPTERHFDSFNVEYVCVPPL